MSDPRVLLSGLAYVESPRWHEGRLWFAHWGAGEIVAVDLDGTSEVVGQGPAGLGWSIDWLPDGRLLIDGRRAHPPRAAMGPLVAHADLSDLAGDWNELVVDGRGDVYANGSLRAGSAADPPRGSSRSSRRVARSGRLADELAFPNGMVVTPDNGTLIVAESSPSRLTAYDIADDGMPRGSAHVGRRPATTQMGSALMPMALSGHADVGTALRAGSRGRRRPRDGCSRPRRVRLHAGWTRSPDAVHHRGRMARLRGGG